MSVNVYFMVNILFLCSPTLLFIHGCEIMHKITLEMPNKVDKLSPQKEKLHLFYFLPVQNNNINGTNEVESIF